MSDGPPAPIAPPQAIEWTTAIVGDAIARGDIVPEAVLFLVRCYERAMDHSLRDGIETGLTAALAVGVVAGDPRVRCAWLGLLAEAAVVTTDPRLEAAIQQTAPSTIDDLERLVRQQYEPGEGLLGRPLLDQVLGATALLTAFDLTGRLAYPMLAEELAQYARRAAWDDETGMFRGGFTENVIAARICCRLAALHQDGGYTSSVVVAAPDSYLDDARRVLLAASTSYPRHPESAAHYGLALLDCFALTARPN